MAYGLTPQGLVVPSTGELLEDLRALARGTFGAGIKVNPSSKWGQFLGILADRESAIWDGLQDVHTSRDPDQAQDAALDAACALTGTVRKVATRSSATATLTGTPGTLVAAGKVASVTTTGARFALRSDALIGGGGTVAATFDAEKTGAIPAPTGTLATIETPVAGWTSITNAADATLGRARETNGELRLRRIEELAIAGRGPLDAVRAALLAVPGVTACSMFENVTGSVDGAGLPAKSFQALVTGGVDADILAAIWDTKPAGIESYGAVSGTVLDSEGVAHTVKLERPTVVPVYLVVNLKKDVATWPADGVAQVQAALAAWGSANLGAGVDVTSWRLKRAIGVDGVMDVSTLYLGTAAAPATEATIGITSRQRAALDTARITVNVTNWTETP